MGTPKVMTQATITFHRTRKKDGGVWQAYPNFTDFPRSWEGKLCGARVKKGEGKSSKERKLFLLWVSESWVFKSVGKEKRQGRGKKKIALRDKGGWPPAQVPKNGRKKRGSRGMLGNAAEKMKSELLDTLKT